MAASVGQVRLVGRRRRAGRGMPIWFGAAFVLLGVLVMVAVAAGYRDTSRLADEGVATQGTVAQLYTTPAEGSGHEYWVGYVFTDPASGDEYRATAQVGQTTFAATQVGDPIQVTYLPTDPGIHTVGTPTASPLLFAAFEGLGLLFAASGAVLTWPAIRTRRGPVRVPAGATSAVASPGGVSSVATGDARSRVDVFNRSRVQIVITAVSPVIGLGVVALGAYLLARSPGVDLLFFGGIATLIGTLVLLTGLNAYRNGLGRRMLEVGPDGLWMRGLGWLPWSAVGEVRLDEAHPAGAAGTADGAGSTDGLGPATPTRAVPPRYTRVAIVPRVPEHAPGSPAGQSAALVAGIGTVVRRRLGARRGGPATSARHGLRAYEVERPLEEVVASLRRFAPTASVAAPDPNVAIGDRDAMLAPSFVESVPGAQAPPAAARYCQRRGSLLEGAGVQVEGGGVGTALLTSAIGMIADAVRGDEVGPEVLEVTPTGLSIPGVVDLAWDGIVTVDVEERQWNDRPDHILRVVPADPARPEASRPPRGSPWSIGRLGGSRLRGSGFPAYEIHLNALDAEADAVLDVIAQYHVVDEGP
jgi:hypothetical protein